MTLTDGAIMFIGCALSFTLGYIIGAVRVTRHVNKRLEVILQIMTKTEKANTPVPRSPQAIEDEIRDEHSAH
jgi:hypothetical protein